MTQQIGGALGLAVLVTVYASHTEPGHVVVGMSTSYHTAAGFLAVALVLATALLGKRRAAQPQPARVEELDLAA